MIYIVEDDANIRQMESYALKNSGYDVMEFDSGAAFFAQVEKAVPRLVILDIMLPGEDGLSILRRLKEGQGTRDVPVIMVTAKTTELDAVKGLDGGADDYINKPFGIMEFISRVKAVLRRFEAGEGLLTLRLGGLELDTAKRRVLVDGTPCELTYKEYELLRYMLENQGIVLSRDKIMDRVWDTDFEGESRTVDMHIKTLRQKLGAGGEIIKTVRGIGYKVGN